MTKRRQTNGREGAYITRLLKGKFAIKKCLGLLLLLIGTRVSVWCQTGTNNYISQQFFDGPANADYFLIATLPVSNSGTLDHLHLVATLNGDWASDNDSTLDLTVGNRGGFNYYYTVVGKTVLGGHAHLLAYRQTDGSVNFYLGLTDSYDVASFVILNNIQETIYQPAVETQNATPPGTLVFDTASASYPPVSYTDPSGNVTTNGTDTASSLQVNSSVSNVANFFGNSGNNYIELSDNNGANIATFGSINGGNSYSFTFGYHSIYTGSTEKVRVLASGNVGIGTLSPGAKLEVNGNAQIDGNLTSTNLTTGGITFPGGSTMTSAPPANLSSSHGNVGIGTIASPLAALDVGPLVGVFPQATNSGAAGLIRNNSPADLYPYTEARLILYGGAGVDTGNWGYFGYGADASMREVYAKTGAGAPLLWGTSTAMDGTGNFIPNMALTPSGSLGLGMSNPGADLPANMQSSPVLEVNGNIALKLGATQQGSTPNQNTGAGIVFSDGTIQTTAYAGTTCTLAELVMPDKTIIAQGGDYAESVDVNGDRASYEPGDVMVIDPTNPEHFLKSSKPYSTLVAGIYSTKPGYVGRRQPGDPKMAKTEIPMAMIGIVPTKVTTENGPINVGDLLVTSSTSGYAMKGTDRGALNGAIVGKALGRLDSGTGTVEVLVSLQ